MEPGKTPTDAQIEALLNLGGPGACVEPEAVDEAQLIAYCQGRLEASEAVQTHLKACPYCQNMAFEYRALSRRGGRTLALKTAAAVVAVAALLLFWIVLPSSQKMAADYSIVRVQGSRHDFRGTEPIQDSQSVAFGKNALVEVVIRPATPPEEKPKIRPAMGVFIEDAQGRIQEAPKGSVTEQLVGAWPVFKLRVSAGVLFQRKPGTYQLRFVVGPGGALEPFKNNLRREKPSWESEALKVLSLDCEYQAESAP